MSWAVIGLHLKSARKEPLILCSLYSCMEAWKSEFIYMFLKDPASQISDF